MTQNILKTAVIGLGRIAWSDHLPALLRHPEKFQVTAVVDPISDRCRDTCAKFHVPAGYTSLEELLAHQTPDLVIVASPTVYHAQHTIEALEHGCHVFCDKPVAMSLQEAHQMDETARKQGRKLMIFQPRRLNSDTMAVRSLMESEILGKIYQLKLYVGNYSRRNDWQAFRKDGGGMLRNYGAHYVDQFLCLLHEKLRLLTCATDRIASLGDADDVVKMLLCSESGILLDLDINQASALQPYRWCIYGKYGTAMVRGTANDWEIRDTTPRNSNRSLRMNGWRRRGGSIRVRIFLSERKHSVRKRRRSARSTGICSIFMTGSKARRSRWFRSMKHWNRCAS